MAGTAPHMSPEQAEGKPLDERSDIFSFGAVLYEMLTGTRAFRGHSTAEVASAVLRDEPPCREIPRALYCIVRRCLAKKPSERFATMAEVLLALQLFARRVIELTIRGFRMALAHPDRIEALVIQDAVARNEGGGDVGPGDSILNSHVFAFEEQRWFTRPVISPTAVPICYLACRINSG